MSVPNKHHYVPECYLKAFAKNKEFYSFCIQYKHIKPSSIGKECYIPNYFKITEEETFLFNDVEDAYEIESRSFKKQENDYQNLLHEITQQKNTPYRIEKEHAELFLETLITIKRRNPSLRKSFKDGFKNYFNSTSFIKDLASIVEIAEKYDKEGTERFLKGNFMNDYKSDDKLNDRFRSRFLKECNVTKKILDSLMECKIFIGHIVGDGEFITSDNPGFTIVDDLLLNMGGFDRAYQFAFPLSSKQCIIIDRQYLDKENLSQKLIHPLKLSQTHIDEFNSYTYRVAVSKVFASSKEVLNRLKQKLKGETV